MDQDESGETLRNRIARQGEDALGSLAQDLLENSIVTSAISRAFEARERAGSAQETAMSALNLPSAADIERLARRPPRGGREGDARVPARGDRVAAGEAGQRGRAPVRDARRRPGADAARAG